MRPVRSPRAHAPGPAPAPGLTLVELLVTLSVVALLLGLAAPSFSRLIERNRIGTAAQRLQGHMVLARTEAVRRGVRVTLCKSSDGQQCSSSGGWEQGWIGFADAQAKGQPPAGAALLLRGEALHPTLSLSGNGPLASYISFTEVGQPQQLSGAFLSGTFTLCGPPGAEGRQLVVSSGGRVRLQVAPVPGPCP